MGVIRDILCCCFRTPNLDTGQADYVGDNSGHSYVERLQNRTNRMMKAIPFEYRHMSRFKLINLLPEPEPVPVVSFEQIRNDPEYERIVSSPISLQDKLKQVIQLRQEKISGASQKRSPRPPLKKRRAPMPPTNQ